MKLETYSRPNNGDVHQGWAILAICWAFIACALLSTFLRVWVRWRITRDMGADDWTMVVTLVTTLLGAGLITAQVVSGLGRHSYYLTISQQQNFHALGWGDWIQTFITLALMKVSICLFLLRISDSRNVVRGMYAMIAFVVLFTLVFIFLFLGICRPLRSFWTIGVDGTCFSKHQVEWIVIAQGVLSAISDLILAALPAIFLRNLQISIRTKIGLCTLMGLGVITAICCIVRTVLSGAVLDPDLSWAITTSVGWRLPEVNIGIVCANAPVLRPLYLYFQGRLASQKASRITNTVSKDGISWPSDTTRIASASHHKYMNEGVGSLDMEMGLADREALEVLGKAGREEVMANPVGKRPYFVMQ